MEVYVVTVSATLTLIGTIYVARSSRRSTDLATKIEVNKTQAIAKAEMVKTTTEAETKRIDQIIDSQQGFIKLLQEENKEQRVEVSEKDKLHREEILQIRSEIAEIARLMSICVEERSKFKYEMEKQTALYKAVDEQLKDAHAYERGQKKSTVKGTITGEITPAGSK